MLSVVFVRLLVCFCPYLFQVSNDDCICKSCGASFKSGSPSKCCAYICVAEGSIQESSSIATKETANYFSVRKGCWQVSCISHLQLGGFTGQSRTYSAYCKYSYCSYRVIMSPLNNFMGWDYVVGILTRLRPGHLRNYGFMSACDRTFFSSPTHPYHF